MFAYILGVKWGQSLDFFWKVFRAKLAQVGPRWPKMAQDGIKMGQDAPKKAPRWLKMLQEGLKMAPRWPKSSQDGPTWFQDGLSCPHEVPR